MMTNLGYLGETKISPSNQSVLHVQLTPKKNTLLHVAAQFGQADCVKWILQLHSPSSLLQRTNEKGDTPLYLAANEKRDNPLHLAAREGHLTVVKNLIDAAKKFGEGDAEIGAAAYCTMMLRMIMAARVKRLCMLW